MELRSRPKSNDMMDASWPDVHMLIRHWESEMNFYKDELRFLMILFEKYFTAMVEKENIEATKTVATSLTAVDLSRSTLTERLHRSSKQISDAAANGNVTEQEATSLKNSFQLLEDELAAFVQKVRELKSLVFKLTERIAKTEQAKHLISE